MFTMVSRFYRLIFLLQLQLVQAIKQVANIKRFLPSKFGYDAKKEPRAIASAIAIIDAKLRVHQKVEAYGIPYTYVASNGMTAYFVANLGQVALTSLPWRMCLFMEMETPGGMTVCTVEEGDIAKYTVVYVDDVRTRNKTLHMRPPVNTLTQNEKIHLWEKRIHKSLNKTFICEEALVKKIKDEYAVAKELFLGKWCGVSIGDGPWHFWNIMLKDENFDIELALCPNNGRKAIPLDNLEDFHALVKDV